MKGLAEFIMRGRMQASTVVILGYFLPLLAPIAIALVTLRRGAVEGTILLMIGLMPAIFSLVSGGEGSVFLVWSTLLILVVVYIPALVLRSLMSLPITVLSIVLVCAALSASVVTFAGSEIDAWITAAHDSASDKPELQASLASLKSHTLLAGLIAYFLVVNAVSGLILGRWMQALLYNPGGFGSEFRALRFGVVAASLSFGLSSYCWFQGGEYLVWSSVLALPLILVALSVAHSIAKHKRTVAPWLVLCYLAVFIVSPLIILIGFLDTWLNFRGRFSNPNGRTNS